MSAPVLPEAFLRAGGQLTLGEYAALDDDERAAFVAAGNLLRVELALMTARALSDPEWAAEAAADLDGGDALLWLALRREMRAAADRLAG